MTYKHRSPVHQAQAQAQVSLGQDTKDAAMWCGISCVEENERERVIFDQDNIMGQKVQENE